MDPKLIPYGISDYKLIVDKNYAYVDKTSFIEALENYHSPYVFYLRPRRFGKTLFTSVLSNYYDLKEKKNFKELFKDTYIGIHPTKELNSYYILKFNFTGLITDTREDLEETFINTIKISFDNFIYNYGLKVDYMKEGAASSIFEDFLSKVSHQIDSPLYVILDEYDHFANELLSFQTHLFSDIVSKTGFVRKWYEVLKKGTESIIRRIFATGVSPITLDSLTSGFNIADDITRHESFHEMIGFTGEEVNKLVLSTSVQPVSSQELTELMDVLKKNYDGYLFSEKADKSLFNSDMILYYLKYYVLKKLPPENLIDKNIASDYGKLGRMFELKNKSQNFNVLERILKEEQLNARLTEQFSLEKDFEEDDFKSLLFYLGMLTINKKVLDRVILKVPNYAIKGLYFQYFMKKLNESLDYALSTSDIEDAITEIALKGNNHSLISLVEKTLNKLSNRDYISFDEKYIKLLLLTYCFMSKIYLVKSEYEIESGYIDIALLHQVNMEPSYYGIFELKYISKRDYEQYGERIVDEKKAEAVAQLLKYNSSDELVSLQKLKKWVLVFVNDRCVVNFDVE